MNKNKTIIVLEAVCWCVLFAGTIIVGKFILVTSAMFWIYLSSIPKYEELALLVVRYIPSYMYWALGMVVAYVLTLFLNNFKEKVKK